MMAVATTAAAAAIARFKKAPCLRRGRANGDPGVTRR